MTTIVNTDQWFATQVDRDFITGQFGDGERLYMSSISDYKIIKGVSFEGNRLTVKDQSGNLIVLDTEPDNELFKSSLLTQWKSWDNEYGAAQGDDQCDYKPWAYISLEALAIGLGVIERETNSFAYVT